MRTRVGVLIPVFIVAFGLTIRAQGGPFSAQIENFWRLISNGGRTFIVLAATTANITTVNATNINMTGVFKAPNGTAAAPAYTFTGNIDRGFFNDTTNSGIGVTVAGTQQFVLANGYFGSFTDNTSNIGQSATQHRPANGWFGTQLTSPAFIGTGNVCTQQLWLDTGLAGGNQVGFCGVSGDNTILASISNVLAYRLGGSNYGFVIDSAYPLSWAAGTDAYNGGNLTVDLSLFRCGAGQACQKNGTHAQEFDVYGTTTGPKYVLLKHDGTNGILDTAASSGTLNLAPTNATSVTIGKSTAVTGTISTTSAFISGGSGMAVANVGANSCGTTAATIAGNNNVFVITVGATSGTQCRVAFTFAATTEWDCGVTDSTTTIATRATPVDTTHTDFLGAFAAGDKVTGVCFPR